MDGTILIMAYSAYERQKVRHIIEKTGNFNIIEVGSISQFYLLDLEINELKLVLLDLAFPTENDGFDALKTIRASENRDVPVIVITHSDNHELKVEALKYFTNDYIIKPYQVKRLESSIRSLVRVVRDFHYDTQQIEEIRMSFDNLIEREIKFSKRTQSPLSLILITTLQIQNRIGIGNQAVPDNKAAIFSIAAQKAKEVLRATDTIVINHNRDIIIVLPCTDEPGVRLVCAKITSEMEPEFEKIKADQNEYIYPVYVTFPMDGDSFQMLMQTAFKKVSNKERLEKIVSIPTDTRKYADMTYNRYQKWF
ncbi:MAG: response regulator [Clostridiaceae bacterium]